MADDAKIPFNVAAIVNTVAAAAIVASFAFIWNINEKMGGIQKDIEYRSRSNEQLKAEINRLESRINRLQRRQRRIYRRVNR